LNGFFVRASNVHQQGRKLLSGRHMLRVLTVRRRYFTESAGTIFTLSTATRLTGLLFSPPPPEVVGVSPSRASTSSPLITCPKAEYWRSRDFASARQMKNWLPAEAG